MSRHFYLSLAVGIVAVALLGWLLPDGITRGIRKASTEVLSPVWGMTGWVQEKARNASDGIRRIDILEEEVRILRAERAQLTTENTQLDILKEENARLKEMLGFEEASPFKLLACRVVQRDPSNWWSAILINRGWQHEPALSPDQPVISPRGVVGKVGTVGRFSSRVILMIDKNCKISADVENSSARGIVMGASTTNSGQPICNLTFVARDTEIPVGARVFTSGLGGAFPQGLLIGSVRKAQPLSSESNFGLYRDGIVEPSADLNDLRELFVIVGVKEK